MKPIFIHSAVDDAGMSASEFRVYACLARHDGGEGAWPSVDRVAKICGLKNVTVRKALRQLETRGFIRRTVRLGFTDVFHVLPVESWTAPLPKQDPSPQMEGAQKRPVVPSQNGTPLPSQSRLPHPSHFGGGEGNPLKVIQERNPEKGDGQTPTLSIVLSDAATSDSISAAILPKLAEIAARRSMTAEGVTLAFEEWVRLKCQYFTKDGVTAHNAHHRFESWLNTTKEGKRFLNEHRDHSQGFNTHRHASESEGVPTAEPRIWKWQDVRAEVGPESWATFCARSRLASDSNAAEATRRAILNALNTGADIGAIKGAVCACDMVLLAKLAPTN